eukprot:TRINITY_DN1304_c0_g1_i3.p1 TRINITY_DN1304_c0_g1~~TRINITY_DN1304_c0_g1_i3.p1  ORF type:complete len:1113 (+),score=276.54 TRINITY_DN1304_c0_g1_i3:65-3403(+)
MDDATSKGGGSIITPPKRKGSDRKEGVDKKDDTNLGEKILKGTIDFIQKTKEQNIREFENDNTPEARFIKKIMGRKGSQAGHPEEPKKGETPNEGDEKEILLEKLRKVEKENETLRQQLQEGGQERVRLDPTLFVRSEEELTYNNNHNIEEQNMTTNPPSAPQPKIPSNRSQPNLMSNQTSATSTFPPAGPGLSQSAHNVLISPRGNSGGGGAPRVPVRSSRGPPPSTSDPSIATPSPTIPTLRKSNTTPGLNQPPNPSPTQNSSSSPTIPRTIPQTPITATNPVTHANTTPTPNPRQIPAVTPPRTVPTPSPSASPSSINAPPSKPTPPNVPRRVTATVAPSTEVSNPNTNTNNNTNNPSVVVSTTNNTSEESPASDSSVDEQPPPSPTTPLNNSSGNNNTVANVNTNSTLPVLSPQHSSHNNNTYAGNLSPIGSTNHANNNANGSHHITQRPVRPPNPNLAAINNANPPPPVRRTPPPRPNRTNAPAFSTAPTPPTATRPIQPIAPRRGQLTPGRPGMFDTAPVPRSNIPPPKGIAGRAGLPPARNRDRSLSQDGLTKKMDMIGSSKSEHNMSPQILLKAESKEKDKDKDNDKEKDKEKKESHREKDKLDTEKKIKETKEKVTKYVKGVKGSAINMVTVIRKKDDLTGHDEVIMSEVDVENNEEAEASLQQLKAWREEEKTRQEEDAKRWYKPTSNFTEEVENQEANPENGEAATNGPPASNFTPEQVVLFNSVEEFIVTEKDYCKDLELIMDFFYKPIRDKQIIDAGDFDAIFSDIPVFLELSSSLVNLLQQTKQSSGMLHLSNYLPELLCSHCSFDCDLNEGSSDVTSKAPSATGSKKSTFISVYELNLIELHFKLEKLNKLKASTPALPLYLATQLKNPQLRKLDLETFLMKPFQRIMRYPLLIGEYQSKSSPQIQAQSSQLLKQIKTIIEKANTIKAQEENIVRTKAIIDKLSDIHTLPVHFSYKMELVKEGDIKYCEDIEYATKRLIGKAFGMKRKMIVFDKLILIVKTKKEKYIVTKCVTLNDLRAVVAGGGSGEGEEKMWWFAMDAGKDAGKWWAGVKTEEERSGWTDVLLKLIGQSFRDTLSLKQGPNVINLKEASKSNGQV